MPSVRKRVNLKSVAGWGRRQSEWVISLYVELLSEFMRLKAAGVKFSQALIGQLARTVTKDAPVYNYNFIDPFDDNLSSTRSRHDGLSSSWYIVYLHLYIHKFYWLTLFLLRYEVHDIVHRAQNGKFMVNAAKQDHIEKRLRTIRASYAGVSSQATWTRTCFVIWTKLISWSTATTAVHLVSWWYRG